MSVAACMIYDLRSELAALTASGRYHHAVYLLHADLRRLGARLIDTTPP